MHTIIFKDSKYIFKRLLTIQGNCLQNLVHRFLQVLSRWKGHLKGTWKQTECKDIRKQIGNPHKPSLTIQTRRNDEQYYFGSK